MQVLYKIKKIKIILPGLLVAATGVGAGDLATGAFAGSKLGLAILWGVVLGAVFKLVITEGLTRWQLKTNKSLLEGAIIHLGKPAEYFFITYLVLWTLTVGTALISATGVAAYSLFPIFDSSQTGKIVFGILHSLIAFLLVKFGNYKFFEKLMSLLIILMFFTILGTVFLIDFNFVDALKGLFIPTIPSHDDQSISWIFALIGGVGGTLTILSYGYWIKEENRDSIKFLKTSRIDITSAYFFTAIFGICMIIISSNLQIDKQSSSMLLINLADILKETIGVIPSKLFLIGAYAAIFSSLLGVWQSVPYIYADFNHIKKYHSERLEKDLTKTKAYQYYLIFIAFVPIGGIFYNFQIVQKIYSVFGAFIIPAFAVSLLFLNNRKEMENHKNSIIINISLILILLFFAALGISDLFNIKF